MKEFNVGHQGKNIPTNEMYDHVHDYKPNLHPKGKSTRQKGRAPKRNEIKIYFKYIKII